MCTDQLWYCWGRSFPVNGHNLRKKTAIYGATVVTWEYLLTDLMSGNLDIFRSRKGEANRLYSSKAKAGREKAGQTNCSLLLAEIPG